MSEAQSTSWRINEWFPELDAKCHERLKLFHVELLKANKSLDLVSPKTIPFADVIHFADSILASKAVMDANPKIDHIFDLASGNGFPGLVFACMHPNVKTTLVDADPKRCEFLAGMGKALGLTNVEVINKAVEALPANSIRYSILRGFASISKTILLFRKVVPVGGMMFHMKGDTWSAEVGEIPTQLCSVWTPALVKDYKLPVGPVRFAVVKTDKIS